LSVEELIERKEERDREDEVDDTDWTHLVTNSVSPKQIYSEAVDPRARSVFDDVDRS